MARVTRYANRQFCNDSSCHKSTTRRGDLKCAQNEIMPRYSFETGGQKQSISYALLHSMRKHIWHTVMY